MKLEIVLAAESPVGDGCSTGDPSSFAFLPPPIVSDVRPGTISFGTSGIGGAFLILFVAKRVRHLMMYHRSYCLGKLLSPDIA